MPPASASFPVTAAEEARGRVFEWLQDSFESLQAELRVLSEAVDRQQRGLVALTGAGDAAGRLADLAEALPERIDEAVREALGHQGVDAGGDPDQQRAGSTRLTTLASTAQPPINRSGWQDRLLALRPAGSPSDG